MVMVPKDLAKNTMRVSQLVPYVGNAKKHPEWQVEQIRNSIEAFGFCDPIAVWQDVAGHWVIVEGHGRLLAAKQLGMEEVPVIRLDQLDDEGRRAYTLAHNKLTMNTEFDPQMLDAELDAIEGIDMTEFGFEEFEDAVGIEAEMAEDVAAELPFTQYVDEASNYVVLMFRTEQDWLRAQSILCLEQVKGFCTKKGGNGKLTYTGVGRVIDGNVAMQRIAAAEGELNR